MSVFGNRMKELRQKNNVTLDKLADKINSTKATLSRYENDKRTPDIDFIYKIAEYFNVTTDYLLGRTDDPNICVIREEALPFELQGKVDAIEIVQDALDKGISKETIEEILNFVDKLKKDPK